MIGITRSGDFSKTKSFLNRAKRNSGYPDLNRFGEMGVRALSAATPKDSRETANSWKYRVVKDRKGPRIEWYNTHADSQGKTTVAVLIQYGHGTGTGGYVQGRDYINPAMRPTFDMMAKEYRKKVRT